MYLVLTLVPFFLDTTLDHSSMLSKVGITGEGEKPKGWPTRESRDNGQQTPV